MRPAPPRAGSPPPRGCGARRGSTGDATQGDLPGGTQSGLRVIEDVLTGVDDVEFCRLTSSDVVRHRLVSAPRPPHPRRALASAGGAGSAAARRRDDDRRGRPAARERRTRDDA